MRSYFVSRKNAPGLFTNFIISFSLAVIATRVFLSLTGYIQISNETLHIAHLNWGGLLMAFAILISIMFRGKMVLIVTSVIGGVGLGLFLDEVGKFITADNDYFFRPAAAIIYLFFLFFFIILLYFRKDRKPSPKTRLYYAIDSFEELIEGDFDIQERREVENELEEVIEETDDQNITDLASMILKYVRQQDVPLREKDIFYRFSMVRRSMGAYINDIPNEKILRIFNYAILFKIFGSFLWLVALMIEYFGLEIGFINQYFERLTINQGIDIYLFLAMNILRMIISLILLRALRQLNRGNVSALKIITICLWISLAFLDVFDFYFNQFAAVIGTTVDIALLLFIRDYSHKILKSRR